MNWVKMGFDLIREVVAATSEPAEPPPQPPPAADLTGHFARHRAEVDRNLETIVQMLNAQNERHLQTIKIQQRWNYGLTAAVIVLAILLALTQFGGAA
jgi:hypothetical protein